MKYEHVDLAYTGCGSSHSGGVSKQIDIDVTQAYIQAVTIQYKSMDQSHY
jgi:hypothetical protein